MAGLRTGGPNFPDNPVNQQIHEWMWWRWEYNELHDKWGLRSVLDSPSQDTPGLIWHTPENGALQPPLTYEWWWIPHVYDSETNAIENRGTLYVRDRSKVSFNNDTPCQTPYGEWQEIYQDYNSDPQNRGQRGYTIWADYGVPETDLIIDGNRPDGGTGPLGAGDPNNNWPYSGNVVEMLGDFYIDFTHWKMYGPKFKDETTNLESWGDGISMLGPAWATWQNGWQCNKPNGYKQAPHDVVSHVSYDKTVRETWICKQDHTPTCDGENINTLYLRSVYLTPIPDQSGQWPPAVNSVGSAIMLQHEFDPTTIYKYFFYFQCHKFIDEGYHGTYYDSEFGDDDAVSLSNSAHGNALQLAYPASVTPSDVKFDCNNPNHILFEIKLGGPKHAHFRVAKGDNDNSGTCDWEYADNVSNWFTTQHTGYGSDQGPNADFYDSAWFPNCTNFMYSTSDTDLHTPGYWQGGNNSSNYPHRIYGATVCSALYYVIKEIKYAYEASNKWFGWLDAEIQSNIGSFFGLVLTNYGEGITQTEISDPDGIPNSGDEVEVTVPYPKFYGYVWDLPYKFGDCNEDYEVISYYDCNNGFGSQLDAEKWAFYHDPCGGLQGPTQTFDWRESVSGVTIWEPYDGSPYWDKMLGVDGTHSDLMVGPGWGSGSKKKQGVEWHFGGFNEINHLPTSHSTAPLFWRDFKTFDQLPGGNASSSGIQQGEIKYSSISDDIGEESAVPYPDPTTDYFFNEWGMGTAAHRWIRTVGRNYNKTPKIIGEGQATWITHGDHFKGDNNVVRPIPSHWVCLQPGNKYKITIAAWIKPQFGPLMGMTSGRNYSGNPVTWTRGSSIGVPTDPLSTFNNGWFELSLWTMPSQETTSTPDILTTLGTAGIFSDSNDPVGPWWEPYNQVIRGIGSPKNVMGPTENTSDNIISLSNCLSYKSAGFTKDDIIEHDSFIGDSLGAVDDDMIRQYYGSSYPDWVTNGSSSSPNWEAAEGSIGPNMDQFQHRSRGTFLYDSFEYSPNSERNIIDNDQPGNCCIGLYYDAHWWAPMVQSHEKWTGSSTFAGEKNVGTIGFYPDAPLGQFESNPNNSNYTVAPVSADMVGGLFRIEILEDNT